MKIKELREAKNYNQSDLASELGVDRSAVAKWETGEAVPRTEKLPKLAKVLGCSIDELFEE